MKVTIVFPPAADPSLPYGSLPLLGAVLKRAGYHETSVRDLNLEAFDDLFQLHPLKDAIQMCQAMMADEDSQLNASDRQRITTALAVSEEVLKHIHTAREILRDAKNFYEPQQLLFAKRIFHLAGTILSAPYPNIHFGKYSYSTSPYDSYEEVERAVTSDGGPLLHYFREVTVPSLLQDQPQLIGISVPYFSQLIPAFMLAEMIREQHPTVHITMGGPVVTWGKEVLMGDTRFARWLDSFFIGEADENILGLIEALEGKREYSQIRNIVRYVNGEAIEQGDPTYQLDMNWLPTPDFTMLPLKRYFAPKRIICLTLTRGCYYNKCTFCNYAFIKLARYRMRAPELIAEDIEKIKTATGEDVFCFESDVILPLHLKMFSKAIIARGVKMKWHGVARFEKGMTTELFDLMQQAGCVRLYMGLESANDRVLQAMKKGTTAERMAQILEMCHQAGIAVEAGVFTQFPSETVEEAEDTYRFIANHRHVLTRADVGSFRLLKGAPVVDHPDTYGITITNNPVKRWYHLEYTDPTPRPVLEGVLSPMEKIQQLYPEVALIDVPEDILYTSEKGANVFGKFFRNEDDGSYLVQERVPEHAMLALSTAFELLRVCVTNAGSVYFEDAEQAEEVNKPAFEYSRVHMNLMLHRASSNLYPITHIENSIIKKLRHGNASYRSIQTQIQQALRLDTDEEAMHEWQLDWRRAFSHLVHIGAIEVIA